MYRHALFKAEMGVEGNHKPLKEVVTKHTDNNAHISAVPECCSETGHSLFQTLGSCKQVVIEKSLLVRSVE